MKYNIRQAITDDHAFILSSYLQSYKWDIENQRIRNETYFTNQHKIAQKLLTQKIAIACADDMPDQIYAYLIYDADNEGHVLIHYCFTKNIYRRLGICKALIMSVSPKKQIEFQCSHAHKIYDLKKVKYKLFYNPYIRSEWK